MEKAIVVELAIGTMSGKVISKITKVGTTSGIVGKSMGRQLGHMEIWVPLNHPSPRNVEDHLLSSGNAISKRDMGQSRELGLQTLISRSG